MKTELKMEPLLKDGSMPKWPDDAEAIAARIDELEVKGWKLAGFIGAMILLRKRVKDA